MKVFVSHRHRDSTWAKSLVKHLQAKGFDVWLDELELHPGDNFVEKIRQAVMDSDTVVSVIGGHQPSPHILVEMGMALAQGKRVLPIVIDADTDMATLADFTQLQSIRTHDVAQAAEAIAALASEEAESPLRVYVIKPGDTLLAIAKRFGVSLDALLSLNPHIMDPDRIQVGASLNIPNQ